MRINLCGHRGLVVGMLAAAACLALSACGGDDGSASPAPSPTATPSPTPTPPPATAQFSAPFGLTADRVFDVFGFQADAQGALVPATDVGFRWNAQTSSYELMMPGQQWGRLTGSGPYYAVYDANGGQQPYDIGIGDKPTVEGPSPRTPAFAYPARVTPTGNPSAISATFAFGFATATGAVPLSGTRTCHYLVDEQGEGTLVFNLATGAITGDLHQYYGNDYVLPPTQFTPGSTTFTATGPSGPIDGRFYGPQATEVAVRWKHPDGFTMVWVMVCDSA